MKAFHLFLKLTAYYAVIGLIIYAALSLLCLDPDHDCPLEVSSDAAEIRLLQQLSGSLRGRSKPAETGRDEG